MRSRCDKLREQALTDGLNTKKGSVWRIHCRSCEDCRTELYILETLQRQTIRERTHLGRREVAVLLEQVRQHQAAEKRGPLVWTWAFRLACVWAAVVGAAFLSNHLDDSGPRGQAGLSSPRFPGNSGVSLAVNATHEGSGHTPLGQPGVEAHSLASPRSSLDSRLRQLRRRIMDRRESLHQLIEDEFHLDDTFREDVWDLACAPVVALV